MKRGTPEHPKTDALAEVIAARCAMPAELARDAAIGMEERLFHFCARYSPQGDIGKHSDMTIASRIGWPWDAAECIAALLKLAWLDAPEGGPRLVVHDWPEHAEDSVRKALEREGLTFWDGTPPRRPSPGRPPRADRDCVATESRQERDGIALPGLAKPSQAEPSQEVAPAGAHALPREAFFCVQLLNESIERSVPGARKASTHEKVQEWAEEMDRLHRLGAPGTGHAWAWEEIIRVLEWLPTHAGSGDFRWGQQIRSASTLRKQFPRLHAAMKQSASRGPQPERAQGALDILRQRRAAVERQRRATA